MSTSSQAEIAKKTWELSNNIMEIQPGEEIYRYDKNQQQSIQAAKPWEKDPHFFKDVKVSALALLKMVMHARSGGNIEVMGLLLGKVDANVMVVMDSFALPVEGTETRVNAQAQAYEYMTAYIEAAKQVGRLEKCDWLVPQSSWLRMLALWHRRLDPNAQPKLPRPFCGDCDRPRPDHICGQGQLGSLSDVPEGLQASRRRSVRVPDHPA